MNGLAALVIQEHGGIVDINILVSRKNQLIVIYQPFKGYSIFQISKQQNSINWLFLALSAFRPFHDFSPIPLKFRDEFADDTLP